MPFVWLLMASAFVLAATLTFGFRALALSTGVIANPAANRWSARPVPLLGGPAIVTATALILPFVPQVPFELWVLLAGALAMSLVGLVDDVRPISPAAKFTAQLVTAAAVTAMGLRFPLTGIALLDILVTMLWIVGLTNAFNLLDNMDGLSAGIAAIAVIIKLSLFVLDGEWAAAGGAAVFAGACLGFLAHNLVPQRVFMGDSGSLFLGFFVAGLSTIGASPDSRATVSVLVIPVAVLLVPIFDTVLVIIARLLTGRRVSQGGRDHSSHRLVMAGMSERSAVFFLYALAAVSGLAAILTRGTSLFLGLAILVTLGLAMLILGVTLSRVSVDAGSEPTRAALLEVLPGMAYVRQLATAAISSVLVLLSYYSAYAFRLGTDEALGAPALTESLPVVFICKMLALAVFRTFRSVWRYTDSRDLIALVAASTVGSALSLLVVLFVFEFTGYSRSIFVLDWLLFTGLLAGSRLSLRALTEILRPVPTAAVRVLVYGAGDAGVALLQELRRNTSLGRSVVGFLDDDPSKRHTRVQGLPVLGGVDELGEMLGPTAVQEVIIATTTLAGDRLARVRETCDDASVAVRQFRIGVRGVGVEADLI
jgi:UDP-GlcNAc:undecaprenyl-phosphate GlcNAc-1-phosphate transferase